MNDNKNINNDLDTAKEFFTNNIIKTYREVVKDKSFIQEMKKTFDLVNHTKRSQTYIPWIISWSVLLGSEH